jgi:periplasmic divalent cation tolerance protein
MRKCRSSPRRSSKFAVRAHVLAHHPYQVPAVIALPIVNGSRAYLDWLRAETESALVDQVP